MLSVQEAHCHHCGCLWDTTENSPFCLRCRSAFYFILPTSLSISATERSTDPDHSYEHVCSEEEEEEGGGGGKRRKLSPKQRVIQHVQRSYRWCDGCKEYHWSG